MFRVLLPSWWVNAVAMRAIRTSKRTDQMTQRNERPHAAAPARPASLAAYRARARVGVTAIPADAEDHTLEPDVDALLRFYAAAGGRDSRGAVFYRVVASVLARSDRAERDGLEWQRFLRLLDRHRQNPRAALNCGVLANLIGLAAFGDAADLAALGELSDRLGVERVAAVQHRAARFVEPDLTFPITTTAVRRMVAAPPQPAATPSLDSAVALLLEGLDLDRFLPVIRTEAQLLGAVDGGSVLEWRHHLGMIAASPWSPYSRRLVDLAESAGRPHAAAVVEQVTEICREQNKEREREQVAEEVRRLVFSSGVSHRQFAQWVGTSHSRLSTYVSGTVTPSASLMLRMARTSRLLQEREVPHVPSTTSEQVCGAARAAIDGGGPEAAAVPSERVSGSLGRTRSHLSAV